MTRSIAAGIVSMRQVCPGMHEMGHMKLKWGEIEIVALKWGFEMGSGQHKTGPGQRNTLISHKLSWVSTRDRVLGGLIFRYFCALGRAPRRTNASSKSLPADQKTGLKLRLQDSFGPVFGIISQ